MRINRLLICCAIFVFGYAANASGQVKIIETIAGSSANFGGDNSPATSGSVFFNANYMISTDGSNNLYIADNGNSRIRKISGSTAIINTVAGNNTIGGYTGEGSATGNKLNQPVGVAVDPGGNFFYIGDQLNNRIRKVDIATGLISSIAGNGTPSSTGDGFAAVSATVNAPRGIAVDGAGNVYFSEGGGTTTLIRKITASSGIISTIAGNGTAGAGTDGVVATTTSINNPRGICVDALGNVYFADLGNNKIRMIAAGSLILTAVAGTGVSGSTGDGGPAVNARLNGPTDVTFDAAGNMYISDNGNRRIRYVDKITGIISTVVNTTGFSGNGGDGGPATAATLTGPASVAFSPNGSYYISDRSSNRIRQVRNNSTPYFTSGSLQTMTVCQNSAATSINLNLATTDTDRNQTLTWTQIYAPNSTLVLAGTSLSTGGSVTPGGKTYKPNIGFSGTDTFIVRVSDGYATSNDTVIVTVHPLPTVAAITGPTTVCPLASITLSDATAAGVWSAQNGNATVTSGGVVSGVTAGTNVISYAVTDPFGCATVYATYSITVNPMPNAGTITGATFVCMSSSTPMSDGALGGVWSSGGTVTFVSGTGVVTALTPGTDNIAYTVTNSCGTAIANYTMSVIALPFAGSISGPSTVCEGGSVITLTDATPGGGWSESTGNATVVGGTVTGVTAGPDVIAYTFTNACGSDVTTQSITVLPLPNAGTISAITNNVCVAGTVSLSDAVSGGGWTVTTGNASVSGTGVVTGVTAGTDVITYTVTNSCGTATTDFPVTVVTVPSAGTITGLSSVCATSTVTLSDDIGGGAWSVTTGKASISGTGVVTGVAGGTDLISYTVTFSCGTATSTYSMTVNPLADAGVITGPSNICIGSFVTLSDATPGGVWSSSNTAVATVSGGVVTSVAAGPANILYTATNICGSVSATQPVTVSPYVTPSITFSALPGFTSCAGGMVTYTPIPVSGGVSPAYQWSVNGTPISTGAPFNYTPNNGDTIAVTMTSSYACLTVPTASRSQRVVVNPLVIPSVNISTGIYSDTVCTGTLTGFTATAVNGGTVPSYSWIINGIVSGGGNPYYYYPVNGDIVSCVLTSGNMCATPATAASNNITMTVDPLNSEIPKVDVLVSPGSTVCNGTPVTFIASTLYGGVSPFLRWTKNGMNVATGPTYTYMGINGDKVHCMLESSSACLLSSIYDTVFSPDVTVSVLTEVAPHVTITAASAVVGKNEVDIFTAGVTHPTASMTYQWFVNGVAIPGETASTFSYSQPDAGTTIINCVVTSGDVCNYTSISNLINLTISGLRVAQTGGYNDIKLLPNPNKGTFTIEGTVAADTREVALEVMNVVGQVVYKETATVQNGMLNANINMGNDLANGVYLLHMTSGEEHKVIRFSVNK